MAVIGIEKLSSEIEKELTLYSQEVATQLKKVAQKYAKELAEKTKATAPSGTRKSGKFKDSIKFKKLEESLNGVTFVWYVDSKNSNYRLTHLIVNGHAKRNGGRTKANDFLKVAVESIEQDYIKAIEEVIQNG